MKVFDKIKQEEKDLSRKELIDLMLHDRQIDLVLHEKKSDEDGYLTWDAENWSAVNERRFIRCYALAGRVLRDSTTHNIYDLENDFKPDEAKEVYIN